MHVSGPGTYSNLQFASAGANLLFHFGSETQPETLIVSMVERDGGVVLGAVDVVATWNAAGTVLTLNPSGLLSQDANPATDYELRIEALLWSDGSAFVPLNAGVAGAARFQFQVGEAPTYLLNPTPSFYTDNLGTDDQDVAVVSCDARVCWLLDVDGYPIGGPVNPSTGGADEAHINETDGFQLTWAPVADAIGYHIYARQSYDGPEAVDLQGWVELEASSIVTGNFSAGASTTVYATGILATGSPTWTHFGAGGAPGVGNTLAFGNVIELAVTAVDAQGLESPIDENKTLALVDVTPAGLVAVHETEPEVEATGVYDVVKSFEIDFSELIQPGSLANWSLISDRVLSMTQPQETVWGDDDVFSGDNVSEHGRFDGLQLDMRWPCAVLTEDASPDATTVTVNDASLFPTGGGVGVEVMFLQGANGGQAAHPGVRQVFSSNAVTGELEFFDPLSDNGGNGLSAGDFVCVVLAQSDLSTSGGTIMAGTNIASTESVHLFHMNQPVVIINKKQIEEDVFGITVHETTVTGVQRTIYNDGFILQIGHLYL
ncbi:MAG: hypothetical protein QF464_15430, partial [Myxococcota bacterium]|nr:hypothetical protein [Myxococcota bacterium]